MFSGVGLAPSTPDRDREHLARHGVDSTRASCVGSIDAASMSQPPSEMSISTGTSRARRSAHRQPALKRATPSVAAPQRAACVRR
jgi:hypothetical protein